MFDAVSSPIKGFVAGILVLVKGHCCLWSLCIADIFGVDWILEYLNPVLLQNNNIIMH